MKRNMDLARMILFDIEKCENPMGPLQELKIEGYSSQEISYHIKLLYQAGLMEAGDFSTMGEGPKGFCWFPGSLTWEGHEFLEAARDDNRWNKTKKLFADKGGGLVFEALKFALIKGIKNQFFPTN